ncbi:hypothetical protein F5Y16DRAFT_391445 [Xylariaceae sp. FL0255]|nr:hypothetical protein F5Y16DRAFT_391445 [Xylariaceae sp. FL0255]
MRTHRKLVEIPIAVSLLLIFQYSVLRVNLTKYAIINHAVGCAWILLLAGELMRFAEEADIPPKAHPEILGWAAQAGDRLNDACHCDDDVFCHEHLIWRPEFFPGTQISARSWGIKLAPFNSEAQTCVKQTPRHYGKRNKPAVTLKNCRC